MKKQSNQILRELLSRQAMVAKNPIPASQIRLPEALNQPPVRPRKRGRYVLYTPEVAQTLHEIAATARKELLGH